MNILLGCDSLYYNRWAKNCIKSIQHHTPWINISIIIVNPQDIEQISNVNYIYDHVDFKVESSKIAYYQAVRFLKCADIFSNGELVMSIDCDTLLTKGFIKEKFYSICKEIHIQRHQKDIRWMAGLVTYGENNNFRQELKKQLLSLPIEQWSYGRDQDVLEELSTKFNFKKLYVGDWMSFGRGSGIFLTLKGDQKISPGYIENYKSIFIDTE